MHAEIDKLFDLSGRVTMVTGGARGLGWDAARVLAAAGAHVVVTSRDAGAAEAAAAKLSSAYGQPALGLELDHTDAASVVRADSAARAWEGSLDILINNAGGTPGAAATALFDRSVDDIDRLLQTNLNGVVYCCKIMGARMAAQKHGKIINIASIAGMCGRDRRMYDRHGLRGQSVDYAAAKAGVIGLTRDLAAYLGPMGVNVNAISPGGFNRGLPEGFVQDYSERTALGRMGRDGVDLNGAILFLASPASDYVTGHNLVVDGGFSLWH